MKVKVLQDFRDRESGMDLRKAGTVLEVSGQRAEKLIHMQLVEKIPDGQKENSKGNG